MAKVKGFLKAKNPKEVFRKIGKGLVVFVSLVGLATAAYCAWKYSKKDKVEVGALDRTPSISQSEDTRENDSKYEKPDNDSKNDGQIHDEDGKNDINRNEEEEDAHGVIKVGQKAKWNTNSNTLSL